MFRLSEALALPSGERVALVASFVDSADADVAEDAKAASATEINLRLPELDSGAVTTIPWAEVRRRLATR